MEGKALKYIRMLLNKNGIDFSSPEKHFAKKKELYFIDVSGGVFNLLYKSVKVKINPRTLEGHLICKSRDEKQVSTLKVRLFKFVQVEKKYAVYVDSYGSHIELSFSVEGKLVKRQIGRQEEKLSISN